MGLLVLTGLGVGPGVLIGLNGNGSVGLLISRSSISGSTSCAAAAVADVVEEVLSSARVGSVVVVVADSANCFFSFSTVSPTQFEVPGKLCPQHSSGVPNMAIGSSHEG